LTDQYLPTWESLLEHKIDALSAEIEAVQTENQRDALCCEQLWLQDDTNTFSETLTTYDVRQDVANLKGTEELLRAFYTFWYEEVTLLQKEEKKRFLEFYQEFLQMLQMEMREESVEPETLLSITSEALYDYLVLLNRLPSAINTRYSTLRGDNFPILLHDEQESVDPDIRLSDFKNGYIHPQLIDSTDVSEWRPRQFEQRMLPYLEMVYKAGHYAEISYVDEKLQEKDRQLEALLNDLNVLLGELSKARMNKQSAVVSLRQRLDMAINSYEQAAGTFENMQGVVDAMIADAALQDGMHEKAIRFALRALAASPDTLSSYETLILTLPQLSNQTALSHVLLDEIFQELTGFSDRLSAEGKLDTLAKEHKVYLSRIYFECASCFAKVQNIEQAGFAIERAIAVAELVENNEANVVRLQRWHKTLLNQSR
jgi:tetratricopeptide (TPR) repeat protein